MKVDDVLAHSIRAFSDGTGSPSAPEPALSEIEGSRL